MYDVIRTVAVQTQHVTMTDLLSRGTGKTGVEEEPNFNHVRNEARSHASLSLSGRSREIFDEALSR